MSDLPELKYLDEAARAADWQNWKYLFSHMHTKSDIGLSVIAHARTLQKLAELEAENATIWKWIERYRYDSKIPGSSCIDVLLHYPAAPWKSGVWDVTHKPYAEQF